MPQLTEYYNVPNQPFTLHTSIAASSYIRIRISNVFGVNDLPITRSIIIPNSAQVVSNPIYYQLEAQSVVTGPVYGAGVLYITSHPGSRTTSWYSYSFGNYVGAPNMTDPSTQSEAQCWVIVGDSITDGRGSDTDGNDRCVTLASSPLSAIAHSTACFPVSLSLVAGLYLVLQRMQENPFTANIAVLNEAAGGNRILYDGLGPNALGRIDRDILVQSGIKYIMIFEGANDIGTPLPRQLPNKWSATVLSKSIDQIIARVHTFGLPIFAATITPFGAPNDTISRIRIHCASRHGCGSMIGS
ncbi:SGNH hydrolase-type esterase domain-containing protein [Boletus reticuloceps]|uniref:SGNH hydrolase-type esterase domain-containing protein n=1 Tax=Boletus reticuloceps TaxID=495285 RepID=A0A8I2YZD5_9AGAM|nr:SGNH hydrolase-type esterase domain-containing protein [Boletus reticuloceps]